MKMIDEEVLVGALIDVADSFEISTVATDRILDEARQAVSDPSESRVRSLLNRGSWNRKWLVAAAFIVVVGGVAWPLIRSEHGPSAYRSAQSPATHGASSKPSTPTDATGAPLSPRGTSMITATGTGVVQGAATSQGVTVSSEKIESNGTLELVVKNGKVNAVFTKLTKVAVNDGGLVVSTEAKAGTKNSGRFAYGTIVLQVPQRRFTTLVDQVQKLGRVASLVTSSNNVTGQYVDLKAHITALETSRQQYLKIMARATSISGILAVQSQLDALQSQIEQLQGQLNVLNNQTLYGSLTVNVSELGQSARRPHRPTGIAKAWHDGINGFVGGFEWVVRLAGPVLFALIFLSAVGVLGRFIMGIIRRRQI